MYYLLKIFIITRWCLKKVLEFFTFSNPYKESWDFIKQFIDITKLKPASGALRARQLSILEYTKEIVQLLEKNGITPILAYGSLIGAVRHKGYIPWDDDIDFDLIREDYEKLIELAKEKYIYIKRPMTRYWSWNKILSYEDSLFHKYPNQLIFVHAYNHLQVYRATSYLDFKLVDFFCLDYYAENYEYDEHKKYLNTIRKRIETINNNVKEVDFLNEEIKSNPNIVAHSNKIMYGIDSDPSYTSAVNYGKWFYEDDLYPLKKMQFEDTQFWVPNNFKEFLTHRYGNWQELPQNLDFSRHFPIVEEYIKSHYKNNKAK